MLPAAGAANASPRQKKLAAKRRAKEQLRKHQHQQLQQHEPNQHTRSDSSAVSPTSPKRLPAHEAANPSTLRSHRSEALDHAPNKEQLAPLATPAAPLDAPLPQHLVSLQYCFEAVSSDDIGGTDSSSSSSSSSSNRLPSASSSRISYELADLSPHQALSLLLHWAEQSRAVPARDLRRAAPALAELLPALRRGAADGYGRQEIADAAWGLLHFDDTLAQGPTSAGSGSSGSSGEVPGEVAMAAASFAPVASRPPGPRQWAAEFEEAMQVPFRVVPRALPDLRLSDFLEELRPQLRRDVIYLDGGARAVEEPRLTGWQSDIGATFQYSGKEMAPAPGGLSPLVRRVRDRLRVATGHHYDGVLINLYEDGKCGMRYHFDPLYDAWTPNTAVVSLGATRQFVFREASDHSVRWHYRVSNGDCVEMFGDCQDRLQHCVKVEKRAEDAGPRVSLVFKQRARNPDGSYAGM